MKLFKRNEDSNTSWDDQRESMYNAWANQKTFLEVKKTDFKDNVVCSVEYNGIKYQQRFYFNNVYGSADPFTIAFNRLQLEMKQIDDRIELKFPV